MCVGIIVDVSPRCRRCLRLLIFHRFWFKNLKLRELEYVFRDMFIVLECKSYNRKIFLDDGG